jgi:phage terminase Nu1 subunit (DNA packaging protein)
MTAKRKSVPEPDMSLAEACRRKESAIARRREFDLDVARGKFLLIADVHTTWSRIITGLRNGLLSIPNKIRMALPHLSVADVETIRELIRSELTYAALNRGFKPTIEATDDDS